MKRKDYSQFVSQFMITTDFVYFAIKHVKYNYGTDDILNINIAFVKVFVSIHFLMLRDNIDEVRLIDVIRRNSLKTEQVRKNIDIMVMFNLLERVGRKLKPTKHYYTSLDKLAEYYTLCENRLLIYEHFPEYRNKEFTGVLLRDILY